MTSAQYPAIDAWIDAHFDEEVRFLQQLVQVPTDTPPGNNTPHALRTAELLKGFGFVVHSLIALVIFTVAFQVLSQPWTHGQIREECLKDVAACQKMIGR